MGERGKAPSSPLRNPEVLAAIREIARRAPFKLFRLEVLTMLAQRFQLHPRLGQLNGALWREGIKPGANSGNPEATDGAAALALALRRSRDMERRRALRGDHQAILRASRPGPPPLVDYRTRPEIPKAAKPEKPAKPARVAKPRGKLATAAEIAATPAQPAIMPEITRETPVIPQAVPVPPVMPVRPLLAVPTPRALRIVTCCWPIGEPGRSGFRYCDDPSFPGRPYCEVHCRVSYDGWRPDRQAAAVAA